MGPVSRWAVFNPKKAVGIWVLLMVAIFAGAGAAGSHFNDSFTLPDTESKSAQDILESQFSGIGASSASNKIVFSTDTGKVTDPAVKADMTKLFNEVEKIDGIESVTSPYAQPASGGSAAGSKAADPSGTAGSFLSPISKDGTVAYATVTFSGSSEDVSMTTATAFFDAVDAAAAANPEIQIGVAGDVTEFGDPPKSELFGVIVALIILLVMFGSVVAAGIPILAALIGLMTGLGLVTVMTNVFDIATFAPTLASMIGLGVGIDYSLFVINRYKLAVEAGRDTRKAAIESVNTSGRAVLFAGTTVIIALAGLFVLGINFLNGLAIAAMLTVLMVMLGALWLLPAVLAWMGHRAFAWKMPWARKHKEHPKGTFFARYGNWLQGRPVLLAIGAIAIMIVIALPTFSMRQGFPDASGNKPGTASRVGYDLLSEGFGQGINGPFLVVADLPETGDLDSANELAKAIQQADGVAGATNAIPNNAKSPDQSTSALITVYPTTGPQDIATADLLNELRDNVIPVAESDTGVKAYVGGSQAIIADFGQVLTDALPLFLAIVIGLGFLALMVLFRSLVVPLTAALTSLLSFAAGLGACVAVFQWGWLADLLNVTGTGPIFPFLPVMLFAILFGLSMDYQVFLVSRMQEEWVHTGDNKRSVRRGLAGSGRVVAAAGAIMFSVFVSFVFGDDNTIKLFGLALSTAVLLDAFVIRLVFVPSIMTILGKANWWLPGWLDRLLPHFAVEESDEEFAQEAGLIEDIPDADDELETAGAK